MLKKVILYTKENCPLCDEAKAMLLILQAEHALQIEERDIHERDEWLLEYQLKIPVISIDNEELHAGQISLDQLEGLIRREGPHLR